MFIYVYKKYKGYNRKKNFPQSIDCLNLQFNSKCHRDFSKALKQLRYLNESLVSTYSSFQAKKNIDYFNMPCQLNLIIILFSDPCQKCALQRFLKII